jgi:hypothetical protein
VIWDFVLDREELATLHGCAQNRLSDHAIMQRTLVELLVKKS